MSNQPRIALTRIRERLACAECRRRKLKCDRGSPCANCRRRGESPSCFYQALPTSRQDDARLDRLESLVQHLASQSSQGLPAASVSTLVPAPDIEPGQEVARIETDELIYSGTTRWSAMLDDIQQLRTSVNLQSLSDLEDEKESPRTDLGVSMLYSCSTQTPIQQILEVYLPPRKELDRYVSAYLRARSIAAPFIHSEKFRKEYDDFFKDPTAAPPLWISMIFSICHIAAHTTMPGRQHSGHVPSFTAAAAHCLVIGQYIRPQKLAVEALLLFIQSQILTGVSLSPDVGIVFGTLVRLATAMGYHRDPDSMGFSAFDGEMRRRTWSMCMQIDLLVSFGLGLPSNVQCPTWDTRPPRNLWDSDFHEVCSELPPERPDSELTNILFYIAKHRLFVVFEKIIRHVLSVDRSHDAETDKLDAEIRAVYASLPPSLQHRTMSESVVDPSNLIVTRLCVSFVYQKSLCALHRPYVLRRRAASILTCHEAASELVRNFVDAYHEFLPGGQAESEGWFISGINWQDFLFCATALCLVLCIADEMAGAVAVDWVATLALLAQARAVCAEGQNTARDKDTRRAVLLLDAMNTRFVGQTPAVLMHSSVDDRRMQDTTIDMREGGWNHRFYAVGQGDDPSWEYLEKFLNIPPENDDTMY